MTTGPCVISAGAARETLFEGKADYCMIVCEYCLLVSRVHMLLLPWTSRPGGSKCASRELPPKLPLGFPIDALRDSSQLIANQESTRPQATLMLSYRRLPRGFIQFLPNLTPCFAPLSEVTLTGDTVEEHRLKIVIWLILPVVICLSQRLSHACLSISVIQRNCEWLIKTVIVYLIIEFTWITVVILELIHAGVPDFCGRAVFIR